MSQQRGNILFLILLAVVLFAALTYAVTGSQREKVTNITKERAEAFASVLIQNASLMEQTMMRSMTVDGTKDFWFDMRGTYSQSSSGNSNCTIPSCKIYSSIGGPIPSIRIEDPFATGTDAQRKPSFERVKLLNVGTPSTDLIITYGYLKQELCEAINRLAGNTNANLVIGDSMGGNTAREYSGTLTAFDEGSTAALGDTPQTSWISGRHTFCYRNSTWGYTFVHALIVR